MHRAAKIDHAFQDWRAGRASRRGLVATAIPTTGYGSTSFVRVLARVVYAPPGGRAEAERHARGWRSFATVPVDRGRVTATIAGERHELVSDRGGVIDAKVAATLDPGWHRITLETDDGASSEADVVIVDPATRFGIISDIDDTVMVTALPRPFVAAWNTFVRDEHARMAVPGMSVLLDRLTAAAPGAPVIYLSTGAWNAAPTLRRFLTRHVFPSGPLLLTDWGPTPDRIFRSGPEHKRTNLERIREEFPHIRWLLIGDDGQHDPVIYDEFVRAHPDNVHAVAIRQLSASEAVLAGGRARDSHWAESRWVSGPDGARLLRELDRIDGSELGRGSLVDERDAGVDDADVADASKPLDDEPERRA